MMNKFNMNNFGPKTSSGPVWKRSWDRSRRDLGTSLEEVFFINYLLNFLGRGGNWDRSRRCLGTSPEEVLGPVTKRSWDQSGRGLGTGPEEVLGPVPKRSWDRSQRGLGTGPKEVLGPLFFLYIMIY